MNHLYNMGHDRTILHVDMNSFYASVEAAYNPSLKGKPIAIAGNPEERRGIIVTSSYEARRKGVRTTMPIWEARRKCPELMILRPNFTRYRDMSKRMFNLLATITECVEPVSIDEGYLDVTHGNDSPYQIAQHIQERLFRELDLPCSIGIAPNKFLAKMASDMKKPLGITRLQIEDLPDKLWPLPIEKMYGVGEKTAEKLRKIGIDTIGMLVERDVTQLRLLLGKNGERLQLRALGKDDRPVDPAAASTFKSLSSSTTLPQDTADEELLSQVLQQLVNKLIGRMHDKDVFARHVQVTIRYHNWKTVTRSRQLSHSIYNEDTLRKQTLQIFHLHWNGTPVRLLGITVSDLVAKSEADIQLDLFTYQQWDE